MCSITIRDLVIYKDRKLRLDAGGNLHFIGIPEAEDL